MWSYWRGRLHFDPLMASQSCIPLHNGSSIPSLGLGFYLSTSEGEAKAAGLFAIEKGYRLLDTAALYDNEVDVGKAVRECGLSRDQIYVTTKLWYTDHGRNNTMKGFNESLRK